MTPAPVTVLCERLGVSPAQLTSRARSGELVRARALAAWVLSHHLGWTVPRIAGFLGRDPGHVRRVVRHGWWLVSRDVDGAAALVAGCAPTVEVGR